MPKLVGTPGIAKNPRGKSRTGWMERELFFSHYEEARVEEYWVVDPEKQRCWRFCLNPQVEAHSGP
jgi:hypothetical protein